MSYIPTNVPPNIPLFTTVFVANSVGFNSYSYAASFSAGNAGAGGFANSMRFWMPAGSKIKVVGDIRGTVPAGFTVEIGFQLLSSMLPGGYSAISNVSFTNTDGANPAAKTGSVVTLGSNYFVLPYAKYSNGVNTYADEILCQVITG